MKAQLNPEEQQAVAWARQGYGRFWRKHFRKSREQHNAGRPRGIRPEVWDSWYDTPFGDDEFNRIHGVLRRLQADGRLP